MKRLACMQAMDSVTVYFTSLCVARCPALRRRLTDVAAHYSIKLITWWMEFSSALEVSSHWDNDAD
jgi:hypothetical protein